MPRHLLVVIVSIAAAGAALPGCSAREIANRRAEQNRVTVLRPDVPFDPAAAAAALAPGSAVIDGVAFYKVKKSPIQIFNVKTVFAENEEVTLRPATRHVLAWLALRDQTEDDDRTRVELDPAARDANRTTKTDRYGRFRFENVRPGRYHLESEATWSEIVSQRVAVGSVDGPWGAPRNVYRNQASARYHTQRLSAVVEIAEEGEVLEIDLRK